VFFLENISVDGRFFVFSRHGRNIGCRSTRSGPVCRRRRSYSHVERALPLKPHAKRAQPYYLCSALPGFGRVLPVIEEKILLEQDCGPFSGDPSGAGRRCWEIHTGGWSIRQPVPGFGRLLAKWLIQLELRLFFTSYTSGSAESFFLPEINDLGRPLERCL